MGLNTESSDGCPIENPDGENLFIASNRPGGKGMLDIWAVYNQTPKQDWGDPTNLPEPVNSAFNDFCPTPLSGNRLFFVSNRPSICGGGTDIYETRLHLSGVWLEPKNLGCQVNGPANEWSPSVFEVEGQVYLYFSSERWGAQKIFSSMLQPDGTWTAAEEVRELSSSSDDARPNVRADGLEIVFDSTRQGGNPDIWTATRASVHEPWSRPFRLGPNVNSTAAETRASISRDGERLYFGSTRAGGQGSTDVFVSQRATRNYRDAETPEPLEGRRR